MDPWSWGKRVQVKLQEAQGAKWCPLYIMYDHLCVTAEDTGKAQQHSWSVPMMVVVVVAEAEGLLEPRSLGQPGKHREVLSQIKEKTKVLNRQLCKYLKMANMYMNRCSTSLIVRERKVQAP
jgi:uncharacterized protein involved in propanediol utilization